MSKPMDRINGSNQSRKLASSSSDGQRADYSPPPPPDESYWSALLREGETASSNVHHNSSASWDAMSPTLAPSSEDQNRQEDGDWQAAQKTFDDDGTVELSVIGYNRGGLLVEWGNLRGFVPASQLVSFPAVTEPQQRRNELANPSSQPLMRRVIEVDRV